MKKILLAALCLGSNLLHADLIDPNRHNHNAYDLKVYSGESAITMYSGLSTAEMFEFSLRTTYAKYRVLRTADGAFEIACSIERNRADNSIREARCEVKQSTDGSSVPSFRPRARMG